MYVNKITNLDSCLYSSQSPKPEPPSTLKHLGMSGYILDFIFLKEKTMLKFLFCNWIFNLRDHSMLGHIELPHLKNCFIALHCVVISSFIKPFQS